jgi:hypothetical protein
MSLRQLGASVAFNACGTIAATAGRLILRPPRATHVAVYTVPCPNEEWPVPAGYGTRAHVLVRFWDGRHNDVVGGAAGGLPIGEIDFTTSTDMYGQPIRLPSDCEAVVIADGGATGATAITRGRCFWFEERAD